MWTSLVLVGVVGCSSLEAADAPGPATSTLWVYRNGTFNWAGDYSWDASIDFGDSKGQPIQGKKDVAVTIIGKWGGFQPYVQGKNLDLTGYKYLIFSLKPTSPNQVFGVGFESVNDAPDGKVLTVVGPPYGPAPQIGKWADYKIPLSDFAFTNIHIQKFMIADGTGLPKNLYYVNDVGFAVD